MGNLEGSQLADLPGSLQTLLDRYKGYVYHLVLMVLRKSSGAEEVVQETCSHGTG